MKVIDASKDKDFQNLLNDVKIAFNYLQQCGCAGRLLEDSDFLPPLVRNMQDEIKIRLKSALEYMKKFEENGIMFGL
jgi:hypothetical protein